MASIGIWYQIVDNNFVACGERDCVTMTLTDSVNVLDLKTAVISKEMLGVPSSALSLWGFDVDDPPSLAELKSSTLTAACLRNSNGEEKALTKLEEHVKLHTLKWQNDCLHVIVQNTRGAPNVVYSLAFPDIPLRLK